MEAKLEHASVIILDDRPASIAERYHSYAGQMFDHIKTIMKSKPMGRVLLQAVTRSAGLQQVFSGITGLFKTACLEHSKLICQMIEAEEEESAEGIAEKASENRMHAESVHVKYENGKRFAADWEEMDISQAEPDIPWKDEGVYLITGGAGGLGLIFAKEIANRTKDTVIILTGRSALREKQKDMLETVRLCRRFCFLRADRCHGRSRSIPIDPQYPQTARQAGRDCSQCRHYKRQLHGEEDGRGIPTRSRSESEGPCVS